MVKAQVANSHILFLLTEREPMRGIFHRSLEKSPENVREEKKKDNQGYMIQWSMEDIFHLSRLSECFKIVGLEQYKTTN
jgi:hypothetical protein